MTALRHIRPIRPTRLASLAVAGVLASAVLTGCGSESEPVAADPTDSPSDSPSASESGSADPTTPTSEPTDTPPTSEAPDEGTATVPVYLGGDTPQGTRLFREFHAADGDQPLEQAVDLLTDSRPADPDYRTLLPELDVESVTSDDTRITVTLESDQYAAAPAATSRREARLAVQSLVYTLQGALGERLPVRVLVGGAASQLLGINTATGVKAAPQLSVLGLVNVTNPEHGQRVSGTFTADGVSSSFEATTPWEVRDSSGAAVLDGFTTAEGWMDKLYPWTAEIDVSSLAPGSYTFVAMTDDPSGGEGPGPTEDTKAITVE